jgi:Ran GTPase-activating protein (RanGAP) involved in mRNA processing and transport
MLRRTSKRVKEIVDSMCPPVDVRLSWRWEHLDHVPEAGSLSAQSASSLQLGGLLSPPPIHAEERAGAGISLSPIPGDDVDDVVSNIDRLQDNLDFMCAREESPGASILQLGGALVHPHYNLEEDSPPAGLFFQPGGAGGGEGRGGGGRGGRIEAAAPLKKQRHSLAPFSMAHSSSMALFGDCGLAGVEFELEFWPKTTVPQTLDHILGQLAAMPARSRITRLDLPRCKMRGESAERLAGVLAQCPALAHLCLKTNQIGPAGAESLAGVLGQCPALAHLNLSYNGIRIAGAKSLAGVLGQCRALAHLNLGTNDFGSAGAESLAEVLGQCAALVHLDLEGNWIGPAGAGMIAGVLAQCPALAHLDLSWNKIGAGGAERLAEVLGQCAALTRLSLNTNRIGDEGAESLAKVLPQCPALAHLDVCNNCIGPDGAGSFAGVLAQCPALAHLDLCNNRIEADGAERLAGVLGQCPALAYLNVRVNGIDAVGGGRLQASWCGQASGLLL